MKPVIRDMIRASAAVSALLLVCAGAFAQTSTIEGRPEVLDGRRILITGQEVTLAGIEVPALGEPCRIGGRMRDCGRLARAGLMDLVVGGEVRCVPLGNGEHRCLGAGYDLAFGLIHAGWAVPAAGAPAHYLAKMEEARQRGRGLWRAQPGSSVRHRESGASRSR